MAGKQFSLSYATSSLIPVEYFECSGQPAEHERTNRCSEFVYDYARKVNGYYLPIKLPTPIHLLPPDVVLWLLELRHKADSTDLIQEIAIEEESYEGDEENDILDDEILCLDEINANINEYLEKNAKYQNNELSLEPNITIEIDDHNTHDICNDNYHNNEDTILNLDLHRKKTFSICKTSQSEKLDDWEKLEIQSVRFKCSEIGFDKKNSEIMHSFWAKNPLYSSVDENTSSEGRGNDAHVESGVQNTSRRQRNYETRENEDESSWSNSSDVFQENEKITVLNSSNNYNICVEDRVNSSDQNFNLKENSTKSDLYGYTSEGQKIEGSSVKCTDILNNLDDMIQKFEDIQKNTCVKDDMVDDYFDVVCLKDNEFVEMCQSAELIIEESLRCHVDMARSKEPEQQTQSHVTPHYSVGSDVSDEVFTVSKDFSDYLRDEVTPETNESFDINQIFDDGNNSKPPVPPRRKKKVGQQGEEAKRGSVNEMPIEDSISKEILGDRLKIIHQRVRTNNEIDATVEVPQTSQTKLKGNDTVEVKETKSLEKNREQKNIAYSLQKSDVDSTDELLNEQNLACKNKNKPLEICQVLTNMKTGENTDVNELPNITQERIVQLGRRDSTKQGRARSSESCSDSSSTHEMVKEDYKRRSNGLPNECYSSFDSQQDSPLDLKIYLTRTKPISFTTFPPSDSEPHSSTQSLNIISTPKLLPQNTLLNLREKTSLFARPKSNVELDSIMTSKKKSNAKTSHSTRPISLKSFSTTFLKPLDSTSGANAYNLLDQNHGNIPVVCESYNTIDGVSRKSKAAVDTVSTSENEDHEKLVRARKGSNASDIAAWKQTLKTSPSYFHDDEMDPNSMPSNQWFSSHDDSMIFSINEETSFSVPEVSVTPCKPEQASDLVQKLSVANITSIIEAELRGKQTGPYHRAKAHSILFGSSQLLAEEKKDVVLGNPYEWSGLWRENMIILREGALTRTKITEFGKKVRKNWTPSYAVLTEPSLLLFKDAKAFHAMKMSPDTFRSDLCIDLSGSFIEKDEKLSSRKNVLVVSTVHGLQVLLQSPTSTLAEQWFHAINAAISLLPVPIRCMRPGHSKESSPSSHGINTTEDAPKLPRMGYTRSIKRQNKEESNEDLNVTAEETQTKTKARLKKFFNRRPTKESLVRKGIYKDEPMFGCNLSDVVSDCTPCVPPFVMHCVKAIERKDENMKTDGLYRASGNLSQVQKMRLQVDQNNLSVLEEEEDVHVLTGALKLFFRELKKPLIPFDLFNKAIAASTVRNQKERIRQFREIVQALPIANHNTLDFLLQHLLRVNKNRDHNRMHIPNIAIVFGPTLMWPEEESLNMALDLMKQNLVIECLLNEHQEIFHSPSTHRSVMVKK